MKPKQSADERFWQMRAQAYPDTIGFEPRLSCSTCRRYLYASDFRKPAATGPVCFRCEG